MTQCARKYNMNELYKELNESSRKNLINLALTNNKELFYRQATELGFEENQLILLMDAISIHHQKDKTGSQCVQSFCNKIGLMQKERDMIQIERDEMKKQRNFAYKQMIQIKKQLSQYERVYSQMQEIVKQDK
eukprot:77845_1